jgi:hypothetical protein
MADSVKRFTLEGERALITGASRGQVLLIDGGYTAV